MCWFLGFQSWELLKRLSLFGRSRREVWARESLMTKIVTFKLTASFKIFKLSSQPAWAASERAPSWSTFLHQFNDVSSCPKHVFFVPFWWLTKDCTQSLREARHTARFLKTFCGSYFGSCLYKTAINAKERFIWTCSRICLGSCGSQHAEYSWYREESTHVLHFSCCPSC